MLMTINLLVIDDHPHVIDGIRTVLEQISPEYGLYSAANESKALKILAEVPDIKLVICETRFHDEPIGPEIAAKIVRLYPEQRIIGTSLTSEGYLWKRRNFDYMDKDMIGLEYFTRLLHEIQNSK